MEDKIEELKQELLENVSLMSIVRGINVYNGALSEYDYWENGEDFFQTFYDNDIDGAVRAVCYGDYTYTDDYVIINAYGNLDTITEGDLESLLEDNIDEITEALIDVWKDDKDYDDLTDKSIALLNEITGESDTDNEEVEEIDFEEEE